MVFYGFYLVICEVECDLLMCKNEKIRVGQVILFDKIKSHGGGREVRG